MSRLNEEEKLLEVRKRVLVDIRANASINRLEERVADDILNWMVLFPQKYQKEKTNLTPLNLVQFFSCITTGNQRVSDFSEEFLRRYFDQAINLYVYTKLNAPIEIGFETFALHNFLDNPKTAARMRAKLQLIDGVVSRHLEFFEFSFGYNLRVENGVIVPKYWYKGYSPVMKTEEVQRFLKVD